MCSGPCGGPGCVPDIIMFNLSTRKDEQFESCELSFIWGKMRTAAREAPSQRALRDCSKAGGGKSVHKVLVTGELNTMKHSFHKGFFARHEDLMSPRRELVLL